MGLFDDLNQLGKIAKAGLKFAMDETPDEQAIWEAKRPKPQVEKAMASLNFVCPCGEQRCFYLNETSPIDVVKWTEAHVKNCEAARP